MHNSCWTHGNEAAIRSPEDLVKKPEGSPDSGLPKKYVRKILFKLDYFFFSFQIRWWRNRLDSRGLPLWTLARKTEHRS